jgi:hypothetical protein
MTERILQKTKITTTTNSNVSVIAPYDFDNDGDVDVFIGSKRARRLWINQKHMLLENDGKETLQQY